jgi:hypothetical protein
MTAWSGIGYYECLTRQDIEDNIQNSTFTRLSSFTVDNKLVTKAEVSAYISFTPNASFNAKTSNQIIIKGDINAGGITPPPTPTPTPASFPNRYYVRKLNADCTLTSTYIYADLGAGINPPTVNQYVTLSEISGCYVVVSIDQSNSVTATINAVFATSCTCTSPLISQTYSYSTFSTCVGVPSAYQTMIVSGVYLTNDIIITQGNEMEFSLNPTTNYVSSLTLTPSSGTVSPTTVYVRLRGFYFYSPSGLTIQILSIGASSLTQTVSTAYVVPSPQVVTTTPGSRVGTGTVTLSATVTSNCTADWYAASSGGTALATSTLSFTTPSITATTTYYVEARDISGNNCAPASSTRTAVVATVTPPPAPTPVNDNLVFWGSLTQNSSTGYYTYNNNNVHTINTPTSNGIYPPYASSTGNYWDFNGTSMFLEYVGGNDLENAQPSSHTSYTLQFYGILSNNDGILRKVWAKDSNITGWDIIWEPTTNRFTFRSLLSPLSPPYPLTTYDDMHISYTYPGVKQQLYTFTILITRNYPSQITTRVNLYVNNTFVNYTVKWNYDGDNTYLEKYDFMPWDKSTNNLKFGGGGTGDAQNFKGQVSQVLMYNTALSLSQITSIYQYFSGDTPTSTSTGTGGSTNSTGTGTFYTLY